MGNLGFSYNWNNKLNCDVYTTLRLTDKYKTGDVLAVELKSNYLHNAQVVAVKKIKIEDINNYIAGVDTGYTADECKQILKTMYKHKNIDWSTQPIYFILLKKIKA